MPTYEYHCNACNRDFEAEKRMSDPVDQECAHCGSPDTQRLISHTSFVLKGSGWYVTDYARKNGSNGSGGSNGSRHSSDHHAGSGNGGNGSSSTTSGKTPEAKSSETPPASKTGSTAAPSTGSAG
ncbi:zinc ribbon domain-containing protein [Myxococcota bacterium]|nr:zinc ribbon domain-containing protein [Myxococcota bacterium]